MLIVWPEYFHLISFAQPFNQTIHFDSIWQNDNNNRMIAATVAPRRRPSLSNLIESKSNSMWCGSAMAIIMKYSMDDGENGFWPLPVHWQRMTEMLKFDREKNRIWMWNMRCFGFTMKIYWNVMSSVGHTPIHRIGNGKIETIFMMFSDSDLIQFINRNYKFARCEGVLPNDIVVNVVNYYDESSARWHRQKFGDGFSENFSSYSAHDWRQMLWRK